MWLLLNGVLRIQAKCVECQILDLASLYSFSGIWRLSILLAAANVLSKTDSLRASFFLQTLSCIYYLQTSEVGHVSVSI